jgi:hypothetical protein
VLQKGTFLVLIFYILLARIIGILVILRHALKPHPTVAEDSLPITFNVSVFASLRTQHNDLHGNAI